MREHVSQSKKATTASFSIPSLKHRIPGFGLESSQASPQAVPLVQPLHKPLTHDISRIPLRNPQAKLSISQPGDKYEQEADSVAQQVMQRIAQPVNRQSIQREALPQESELQMKPLANSITPLQRQEMPEDEEELQMKSLDNSTLQRQQAPEEEEELQMKSMVQRQAGMAAAPDLETSINQARGGGQAMAENIRHPMEVAFGADFSGVKVHTDGQSDLLNRSIQARAFTTGQDVFFRQGEYNPGSRGGQELLAHELTHVVQQNGGAVQRSHQLQEKQKQNAGKDTFFEQLSQEVVQRAVPKGGETAKPIAETAGYVARGGQNVQFNSNAHKRKDFSFGTKTRDAVFQKYNPTYQGNKIVTVRASHGEQVSVTGIQLDHQTSWDMITNAMENKNKDQNGQFKYSFWDAKMYYNDVTNLVPAQGSINAAAGAQGVHMEQRGNSVIEATLGTVGQSWIHLQSVLNAIKNGTQTAMISDDEFVHSLLEISTQMGELAEDLIR
ncbi:DUF4157 domain-containing protein [uncultured Nostoc sp.]|uniref:eCIS core domain-containing protein n=1 Tax=uncultured Nostoc sp. TaxID=340711 RepID=UPI0026040AC9|nr:DUF4157 domain-containing protein [uncultured Nostoc sp.]